MVAVRMLELKILSSDKMLLSMVKILDFLIAMIIPENFTLISV